ncbi:MAG: hypothetical protein H7Z75_22725 [Ferruginibacter sp.]|nr:hypothetical protein [Cytophagales bacterium]
MKTNLVFLAVLGSLLASCDKNTRQTSEPPVATTPTQVPATTNPAPATSCYRYLSGKDSVTLRITTTGNAVKGELRYTFFEKDKNTGTLEGQVKGDTIFADYTFLSEGTESVREVAFLREGNDLVEGYGAAKEVNNKMVFENRSALNFKNNTLYKKVDCGKDE